MRLIMCMGLDAVTQPCRTVTTSTIWLTGACIIPMATTATTTAR
jgi:hypothetical protein